MVSALIMILFAFIALVVVAVKAYLFGFTMGGQAMKAICRKEKELGRQLTDREVEEVASWVLDEYIKHLKKGGKQ